MTDDKNLALWAAVYKTDPEYTKQYKGAGGFQGTAIASLYPIQRATEVFGPLGHGWGYEILKDEFLPGAPIVHPELGVIGHESTHSLYVRIWANWQGDALEVTHYGLTPHIYNNKYGVQTDHEAQKKSLTDALKKALVMWGFSADVYLGMHDDPDYLQAVSNDFIIQKSEDKAAEALKQKQEYKEWSVKNIKLLETATNLNELEALYKAAVRKAQRHDDADYIKTIALVTKTRKEELTPKKEEDAA